MSLFVGGTGSANELDDFEEGTFTPTQPTVGLQSSYTYGYYQKVGYWVTVQFGVRINNNGSAISTFIDGLPFNMTADTNGTNTNSFAIGYHNGNHIQFALGNSGDRVFVYDKNGNAVQLTHMDNDYIRIFGTYKTS